MYDLTKPYSPERLAQDDARIAEMNKRRRDAELAAFYEPGSNAGQYQDSAKEIRELNKMEWDVPPSVIQADLDYKARVQEAATASDRIANYYASELRARGWYVEKRWH